MEKGMCVGDLKENMAVEGVFLLSNRSALRETRGGKLFFNCELCDKTGRVAAVLWEATESIYASVANNDYVFIRGRINTYQNQLQVGLYSISKVEPNEVSPADFLPVTPKDMKKLREEFKAQIARVKNNHLSALLAAFFDDKEFFEQFAKCPAAVSYHHPYVGGLLEHTVSVARMSKSVIDEHPVLDADLLVAGCILHDIGKVEELEYCRSLGYTDPGMLIGHLVQAVLMIERRAADIEGFPAELMMEIQHLILSHHGEFEYGSPKLPMTAEAIVLHFLDNMDAKMNAFNLATQNMSPENTNFTDWNRMFDRRLYKRPDMLAEQ